MLKKPKFKLFTEFKEFITRGNVLGLAIGMIIGAAFTAIVNALVNNIFKPLINAIPMNGVEGLITMLVPRDANGTTLTGAFDPALLDLAKSVYIDWGAFIMAIINFFITAAVLFLILKAITSVQNGFSDVSGALKKMTGKEVRELKKQGYSMKEIEEMQRKKAEEEAAAAEAAKAAEPVPETAEDVLKQIRDMLKAMQPEQAKQIAAELNSSNEVAEEKE